MATDYNAIVETIKNAQQQGHANPGPTERQLTVDRMGGIRVSNSAPSDPALSKVQHGTFAAPAPADRQRRDAAIASQKMPPGTYYDDSPGAQGWYYSITTEVGNEYVLRAAFDGVDYKVVLVDPPLEQQGLAGHDGHLYSGGRLCLSRDRGAGQPTLELAYSKSVLWAHGMDFVREGYKFPFAYDQ